MLPSNHLKAVVFDCDGILVDSEPLHYQAFQQVLVPLGLGHDYHRYVDRYIGFDDRDAFTEVFRDAGRSIEPRQLEELIAAKNKALLAIVSQGISSFPGVVQLVRHLSARGVPLAVSSGSLRIEIEYFLKALGLQDCFPVIVSADDVMHSKPDPESYLTALRKLRERLLGEPLEAATVVAIEDTPAGIQSARAAGLFTVGVSHSFAADLLREADVVLDTLEHMNLAKLVELMQSIHSSDNPPAF